MSKLNDALETTNGKDSVTPEEAYDTPVKRSPVLAVTMILLVLSLIAATFLFSQVLSLRQELAYDKGQLISISMQEAVSFSQQSNQAARLLLASKSEAEQTAVMAITAGAEVAGKGLSRLLAVVDGLASSGEVKQKTDGLSDADSSAAVDKYVKTISDRMAAIADKGLPVDEADSQFLEQAAVETEQIFALLKQGSAQIPSTRTAYIQASSGMNWLGVGEQLRDLIYATKLY